LNFHNQKLTASVRFDDTKRGLHCSMWDWVA